MSDSNIYDRTLELSYKKQKIRRIFSYKLGMEEKSAFDILNFTHFPYGKF